MSRDVSKYVVDGIRFPSVTEVLKIAGLTDYSAVDPAVLEAAADRGRAVSEWIDLVESGYLDPSAKDPEIAPYLEAFEQWREDVSFEPEEIEGTVVNRELGVAGMFDGRGTAIVRGERVPVLVDWKAVAALQPETRLQLAGYALAGGTPTIRRYALHLRRIGTYRFEPYRDPQDLAEFQAALTVTWWKLRHGRASLQGAPN